jgi:lysophospholipase L1-like esterase
MKILLAGDSIIEGSTGINWISLLAQRRPRWRLKAAGAAGEPLNKITERLPALLKDDSYDCIVLVAGHNDLFRQSYQYLLRKGHQPHPDPAAFELQMRQCIDLIRQHSRARIILCTLSAMNESAGSLLRQQRNQINETIRDVAWDMQCQLADPGLRFDEYLESRCTRNYFLPSFWQVTWFDKWICKWLGQADVLSQRRRLHLTTDGVHLNTRGAKIFMHEIEKQLLITENKPILHFS